jgi:hypothetical protein
MDDTNSEVFRLVHEENAVQLLPELGTDRDAILFSRTEVEHENRTRLGMADCP